MIVKAGLGLIGLGALSVGSVALAKPGLLGMMPRCTALSKDHDFETTYGNSSANKDKFGAVNKENLVGVVGTTKGTGNEKSSVEEWWEWSFERLKKDAIDTGKFAVVGSDGAKKVGSAYSATSQASDANPKALNRVCEDAYKSETTKVKTKPNSSETDAFDEAQVWKYCSWLGTKPTQAATP